MGVEMDQMVVKWYCYDSGERWNGDVSVGLELTFRDLNTGHGASTQAD
jgi:hypothetical protein